MLTRNQGLDNFLLPNPPTEKHHSCQEPRLKEQYLENWNPRKVIGAKRKRMVSTFDLDAKQVILEFKDIDLRKKGFFLKL